MAKPPFWLRESQWWTTLAEWSERQHLPPGAYEELVDIVLAAIDEDKAAELGSCGGSARAAKLSRKRRAEIARKAAQARWAKRDQRATHRTSDVVGNAVRVMKIATDADG